MFRSIYKYLKQGGIALVFLCFALLINHRTGYITLLGLFMVAYFFTGFLKTKYDRTSFAILAYSVFYILLSAINGIHYDVSTILLYGLFPLIFYQFGKDIGAGWDTDNKHLIFWLLIIFCYCLDIFLVCGANIAKTGELINIKREFSFGTNDTEGLAATLVGLSMDIGVIGLPMTFITKDRRLKVLFFIIFFTSLIVTFLEQNRISCTDFVFSYIDYISFKKEVIVLYYLFRCCCACHIGTL